MWLVIFIVSLLFVFYTYAGYPLVLIFAARFFKKPVNKKEIYPNVSMLIVAFNEAWVMRKKIENCFTLDYPTEKLEIVVATDGCQDDTNKIVAEYASRGVKLYAYPERKGKLAVVNRTIPLLSGEIVVFSDARELFHPDAIKELVWNFNDPRIGAVSGELVLTARKEEVVSKSLQLYWKYEKRLRKREGEISACVGATGAIYAIRKALFRVLPDDIVLDDVAIPLQVVVQGYRVIFERLARAYDDVSSTSQQEYGRKARTLAGNFQILFNLGKLFHYNFRNNFVLFAYFSHKVTRMLLPLFFILFFISCLFIPGWFFKVIFIAQLIFYILALIGVYIERHDLKHYFIFNAPSVFCTIHFAIISGFWRYITKHQKITWERSASLDRVNVSRPGPPLSREGENKE
jgi:poly-beta-1,6-N-acetyl-D-glucosamine synthase